MGRRARRPGRRAKGRHSSSLANGIGNPEQEGVGICVFSSLSVCCCAGKVCFVGAWWLQVAFWRRERRGDAQEMWAGVGANIMYNCYIFNNTRYSSRKTFSLPTRQVLTRIHRSKCPGLCSQQISAKQRGDITCKRSQGGVARCFGERPR